MIEVIAYFVYQQTLAGRPSFTVPATKAFRFEFETLEDAEAFLDTSEDIRGLVSSEQLKA
jgi:hypothetical protein